MNVREIIDALEAQLEIQTVRAERLEAERDSWKALAEKAHRILRETRAEQDFQAEVYAHDEYWARVQAVGE